MTTPDQLFTDFEAKMAAAQQKALQMRAEIETVSVTESSKDGQISVTVNNAGNLTALEIGPAARAKPDLGALVLRTVQAAQSKLAGAMATGVPSIAGSETMNELIHQLNSTFPEPEPDDYIEGGGGYGDRPADDDNRFVAEDDLAAPPPPLPPALATPPPSPPPPDRRPRRATPVEGHDDDYFAGNDFLTDDDKGGRR